MSEQWSVTNYKVRQLILTQDFQAVYWHGGRESGPVTLSATVVDGVALCDAITEECERVGQYGRRVLETHVDPNHVAAMRIYLDTGWAVADEASNYLGMIRPGEDPYVLAEHCLDREVLARLVFPPGYQKPDPEE